MGITAAEVPVKYQSDRIILNTNDSQVIDLPIASGEVTMKDSVKLYLNTPT